MAEETIADLAAGLGVEVDKESFASASESLQKIISLLQEMADAALTANGGLQKAINTISLPGGPGDEHTSKHVHETGNQIHFVKHALSALIGLHAAHELLEMTEHTISLGASMSGLAEKSGTTVEEIQELGYAAQINGLSTQFMANTLAKLGATLESAASGGKGAAQAFREAGIAVKDADGKVRPAADVLGDIADHLQSLDEVDRPAEAMKLLGKQGKEMIGVLKDGRAGLEKFKQEAHEFGLVMDKETVEAMDRVEKNTRRLSKAWEGLKEHAIETLVPALSDLTEELLEWMKANRQDIAEGLHAVFNIVIKAIKVVAALAKAMVKIIAFLAKNWGLVVAAVMGLAAAFVIVERNAVRAAVVSAWRWLTHPIFLLAAAIALAILMLDDLYAWVKGQNSLMGELIGPFDEVLDNVGKKIKEVFTEALDWVKKKAKEAWAAITGSVNFDDATKYFAGKLNKEGKVSDDQLAHANKFGFGSGTVGEEFAFAKERFQAKSAPQLSIPVAEAAAPGGVQVTAPITNHINITGDPETVRRVLDDRDAATARKLQATVGGAKKR